MPTPSKKVSLKPRRYHGYNVFLFILGTLFPPLAVAARFGIGSDFWLNLLLTICGYFPGHGHNFYIQNIRNNKNRARTPKWAVRYGLVDTTGIERRKKRSQWAKRYGERLPESALENQAYEDGQLPDNSPDPASSDRQEYWRENEEQYYNTSRRKQSGFGEESSSLHSERSGSRWTYPANFDEAVIEGGSKRRSKSSKKDRWARTEEAYNDADGTVRRRKKKKRRPTGDTEHLPPLEPEIDTTLPADSGLDALTDQHRDPLEHEF